MAIFHTDIFVNSMAIKLQQEILFLGIFKIVFTHKELGIPKEQLATKSLPFLLPLSADHALSKSQVPYHTERIIQNVSKPCHCEISLLFPCHTCRLHGAVRYVFCKEVILTITSAEFIYVTQKFSDE